MGDQSDPLTQPIYYFQENAFNFETNLTLIDFEREP
jgi:hypothetical protein